MKKVCILCGGPSSEHEVSLNSTKSILKNIDRKKYQVSLLFINKDYTCQYFAEAPNELEIPTKTTQKLEEALAKELQNVDVALLAGLHGEFVEDGQIQALLTYFNIAFTGSGLAASSLCMDKHRSSLLVQRIPDLDIPSYSFHRIQDPVEDLDLQFPLVYKPNRMGSSVGVTIVNSLKELQTQLKVDRAEGKIGEYLLQEFLEGAQELTCGCLEKANGDMIELPPVEINPQGGTFFDYTAKYAVGGSEEICPPKNIDKKIVQLASTLACEIHYLLGCNTYSRSDFMLKDSTLFYLETNTLPGMTATSLIPQEAEAAGMSFTELLSFLIDEVPEKRWS